MPNQQGLIARVAVALAVCSSAALADPVTVTPDNVALAPGGWVELTVNTATVAPATTVTLSITYSSELNGTLYGDFSPAQITMGQSSTLTLSADANTAGGNYVYNVIATAKDGRTWQGSAKVGVNNSPGCPAGFHDEGGQCVPDSGCSSSGSAQEWAALLAFAIVALRRRYLAIQCGPYG